MFDQIIIVYEFSYVCNVSVDLKGYYLILSLKSVTTPSKVYSFVKNFCMKHHLTYLIAKVKIFLFTKFQVTSIFFARVVASKPFFLGKPHMPRPI